MTPSEWRELQGGSREVQHESLAKIMRDAVLAERARCAKIAREKFSTTTFSDGFSHGYEYHMEEVGNAIADEIEKGT